MAARASDKGITYVAFTATPKAKTLQLFGRLTKPDQPVGDDNLPAPFHVYSMRQAIEEGLILDVLQNYIQASNNTKAQFANSPTLSKEIMNAIMDALTAHTTMSKQAIYSEKVGEGLKDVLLGLGL